MMGASAVLAMSAGKVVLRRCELRVPPCSSSLMQCSLIVKEGARATAADLTCSGMVMVLNQGSMLLHTGLAFPPGLELTIVAIDGGVARELPATAGAAGPRAGGPAPPAAS